MKVRDIVMMHRLVNSKTLVALFGEDRDYITAGSWFDDNILDFHQDEVVSFTWESTNKVRITVKK